ncbi:MAG: hypothetical protein ABR974_06145 [Bacteroidales bacterium]|jgi:hypothetical protein
MNSTKNILTAFLLFSIALYQARGQQAEDQKDRYTLLTMPYNLRQLTLYRGQFAISGGYKFAVRSQSYDSNGEKVMLTNTGTGSVYHYYFADIRYGITNFLEVGAETDYIRHGMREETAMYVSTTAAGTTSLTVNKLSEVRGLGDILLFATMRPPMEYRGFDVGLTGGLFLPSSEYKPAQPSDNVTNIAATNSYIVDSYNKFTNGYGVPVYLLSGSAKASIRKFTFAADFSYRTPMYEGKNIRWETTLDNNQFSYNDKSYQYLLSNEYSLNTALHYQTTGWFDLYMNCNWHKTSGGWTEYWGNKYKNPETCLITLEPGFELQISPNLTIYQVAGFPVGGKNSDAPFYLFTTVRFSTFLFHRR